MDKNLTALVHKYYQRYRNGEPVPKLARRMGISKAMMYRYFRRLELPVKHAPITTDEKTLIANYLAKGWSVSKIARKMFLTQRQVRYHKNKLDGKVKTRVEREHEKNYEALRRAEQ